MFGKVVYEWKIRTIHLCILRFHKIKEKLALDISKIISTGHFKGF